MTLMATGMRVLPIFEEMQANGMPVNYDYFQSLHDELDSSMHDLVQHISSTYYLGRPFNPKSSDQVAAILRSRDLHSLKTTATGKASTGKKSIEYLRNTDPAISSIFDWREMQQVRDAYCRPILDSRPASRPTYGTVHCVIKPCTVTTRRIATESVNLLAIPSRTDIGRRVREGYQLPPDSGEMLIACDLSQVEMRVMAHLSRDPLLCQFFVEDRDIHAETASRTFNVPLDLVTKDQRRAAKTTNFGIIYGQKADGLLTELNALGLTGWTDQSCAKLIKDVFRVYSGMRDYIDSVSTEVRRTGSIRDHYGMIRYLPGAWSDDLKIQAEASREAVSHRVQGMAQGMIQNSMAWIANEIRDLQDAGVNIKWRLQVHDELVLSFDAGLEDMVGALLIDGLTNHYGAFLRVPVLAEWRAGMNWGELK